MGGRRQRMIPRPEALPERPAAQAGHSSEAAGRMSAEAEPADMTAADMTAGNLRSAVPAHILPAAMQDCQISFREAEVCLL